MIDASYTIRNYSSDDFDKYLQLLIESEQLEPSRRIISAQGLSDYLGRPNFAPQKDLFVAVYNELLVGGLSLNLEPGIERALVDCLIHPLHRRNGIATELFSHGLQRVKKSGIKSVQASMQETNASARGLLNHVGFKFIRYFLEMRLDIKDLRLPTERQSRTTRRRLKPGEENLLTELQNRCFTGTWGFNPNTVEEIAYRLNMHGRSPKDVILTCLDDRPIGYCWTIIDIAANKNKAKWIGLVHMLGVDPAYRQQEIGKSVLLNGLEDLKAKGIDTVELTVDSENPAACSLYESVGFEVVARLAWYEKLVA